MTQTTNWPFKAREMAQRICFDRYKKNCRGLRNDATASFISHTLRRFYVMSQENSINHLYEDKSGVIHACEGSEVHRGIYLVWTKCEKDVPANKSFKSEEAPTCEACRG